MKLVKQGEVLAREGDEDNVIFILVKGVLGVYKGELEIARFCEKGTIVGEMSAILETPRTATIIALEDSYIAQIAGRLEQLIKQFPDVTKNVLVNLAERLMNTTEDFGLIAEKLHETQSTEYIAEGIKQKDDIMKTFTDYMWFRTAEEKEFIDVTRNVQTVLAQSEIDEGMLHIFSMDSNSSVFVNDAHTAVVEDLDQWLDRTVPRSRHYSYKTENMKFEGSHLRNMLMKNHISIPVTKGNLDLGNDQAIYFAEFDGKKRKRIIIKVIGI